MDLRGVTRKLGNVEASEEGFARFMGIDAHRDAATMRFTCLVALRLCGLEVRGKLLVFSFQFSGRKRG